MTPKINFKSAEENQQIRHSNYGSPSEAQFFYRIQGDVDKIIGIEESKNISDNDYVQLLKLCEEIIKDAQEVKLGDIGYNIKAIISDYYNKLKSRKSREEEFLGVRQITTFKIPKL